MKNVLNKLIRKNTLKEAVLILFFVENFSKVTKFLRSVVISTVYGFSRINDAFNYAYSIITLSFGLVSDALLAGVIPFLNKKENKEAKLDFIYSVSLVVVVIFLIFSTFYLIFFEQFISFIAPGFVDLESRNMLFLFSILLIPSSLIVVLLNTINGYFRSEKIFGITNVVNFVNSLIALVLLLLLFLYKNYLILPLAPLFGNTINLIILLFLLPKGKRSFDKEVFKLLKLSLPLIIGGGFGILNNLVDKGFASTLAIGQLTLLGYSFLINRQVYTLLTGPVSGAAYAFISDNIHKNEVEKVQERLGKILRIFFSFFSLAIVVFIFFGEFFLKILFLHGEVTLSDVNYIYQYTLIYMLSSLFTSVMSILVTVFYSYKETLIPTIISISCLLLNVLLNWIFIDSYGAYALATTTVVASIINLVLSAAYIKYKFSLNVWDTKTFFIMTFQCLFVLFYIINGSELSIWYILFNMIFVIYIIFINKSYIHNLLKKIVKV